MRTATLEAKFVPSWETETQMSHPLLEHSAAAFRLASRFSDSREAAEDIVQQAYLEALGRMQSGLVPDDARAWFFRVVANVAKKRLRSEANRKRRESAVETEVETEPTGTTRGRLDIVAALRVSLETLDPKYRVPLSLCYEEGMTQREAAAVLELPERTLSDHVRIGLEKLRKALERAGYPAAVAVVLGGLKGTAPAVPASLASRVEALVASGARPSPRKLASRTARKRSAVKGGLAMKIVAGIVLAGAAAAGLAVVSGSSGSPLPAEKPKFSIPIWHPDVQWSTEKKCIGGSGLLGHLQGPRREIMRYWGSGFSRLFGPDAGNQPAIYSHDPKIERVHVVAGGAAGYLDGPFSRARFGGWSYGARSTGARSPNGRFVYFTEPYYGKVLRQLDLKEQRVSTVSLPKGTVISMAPDDEGNVYTLMSGGTLLVMDTAQGKVTRTLKLDPGSESVGYALSWSTALDTVNNRLYATKFGAKKYYIWYWDIKDGSFHGVLAIPQKGEPVRPKPSGGGIGGCLPGPFKGTKLYNEGSVYFGPDDPKRRFLYTSRVDTSTFFRLDLEKKEIWVFATDKEKKVFRFIGPGETGAVGTGVRGLSVLPDGGLMSTCPHWTGAHVFTNTRLK